MFADSVLFSEYNSLIFNGGRGGRVAEGDGLLNRCTAKTVPGVRIPPLSANFILIINDLHTINIRQKTLFLAFFK